MLQACITTTNSRIQMLKIVAKAHATPSFGGQALQRTSPNANSYLNISLKTPAKCTPPFTNCSFNGAINLKLY